MRIVNDPAALSLQLPGSEPRGGTDHSNAGSTRSSRAAVHRRDRRRRDVGQARRAIPTRIQPSQATRGHRLEPTAAGAPGPTPPSRHFKQRKSCQLLDAGQHSPTTKSRSPAQGRKPSRYGFSILPLAWKTMSTREAAHDCERWLHWPPKTRQTARPGCRPRTTVARELSDLTAPRD